MRALRSRRDGGARLSRFFPARRLLAKRTARDWLRQSALGASSRRAAAALFIVFASPALAADFPTVVANILNSQTDGRIAKLDPATKRDMIACVNRVLAGLPGGKKRFVVEGASYSEQQSRFGKVVKENRAEWEQKIAQGCGQIAMRKGGGIGHQ
jgi:hypothetical protein